MTDKVLVIGTGAVGSWIGGSLAERGFAVGFLGRGGPAANRFALAGEVGPNANAAVRLHAHPAPDSDFVRQARVAFVAVKAFDLEAALAHTGQLGDGCVVIPVVNGAVWDLLAHASKASRAERLTWRLGYSTVGVSTVGVSTVGVSPANTGWDAPCYSIRAKAGHVDFGPFPGGTPATEIETKLIKAWPVLAWRQQIAMLQRRKWLYNTVINSLCAANGLARNGLLLIDLPMLAAVFDESWRFAEATWGKFTQEREDLYKGLVQLIEATEANENSMARDRRLGVRTESAYLAGLARDEAQYPHLVALHRRIGS